MNMTRQQAHVVVAAIRVQAELLSRSPTPGEIADLLQISETEARLRLNFLAELGAVALVESAFATHVEVADHLLIEELTVAEGPALSEDLREFDRRKQAEADRMARLFDSGEAQARQQEKIDRMDDELAQFKRRRPVNPFGDDD